MRTLAASLLLVLLPNAAEAAPLDRARAEPLFKIEQALGVIDDLVTRGALDEPTAEKCRRLYLDDAAGVLGRAVDVAGLRRLTAEARQASGFGTFLDIVLVFAGFLLLLGVIGLLGLYLWPMLATLPPSAFEAAVWFPVVVFLLAGEWGSPVQARTVTLHPLWLVLPAALGLMAALRYSYDLRIRRRGDEAAIGPATVSFPLVLFGVCAVVWGAFAVRYHHQYPASAIPYVLGFLAVMALQAALGFSALVTPGCVYLGWERERQVPRSVVASLVLLVAYVVVKTTGLTAHPALRVFETGAVFMGAFVYFLGLLVLASKWYGARYDEEGRRIWSRYLWMQVLTVASGVAAFYLGATFDLGVLLGVGGTFFSLYLTEKYLEIPWRGASWAWAAVGLALAMYFFVGFARDQSQYFLWGIKR